jgi:RNA polymerase sigma-70 factor (ECF subfamily)
LLAYSRDQDIANDALDEAFAQAIAGGRRIRDPSSWIWTTAFKLASGELKRRGGTSSFKDPGHTYDMPDPVPDLFAALQELSPKQRAAVILHDYADRPNDEIARVLGIRLQTVHVHLSQGRKRLRELLGGDS